jgi:hypothetical protein
VNTRIFCLLGSLALLLSLLADASAFDGPLRRDSRNPHFFTDNSGKSIYLTGTETHGAFQPNTYGNPDYTAYVNSFATFGHNHQRMRIIENAWIRNADPAWVALPAIYLRTGPGLATDGKPKFDLNQLNPTFFTTLRSRIVACRDREIYVMVMFFIGNHVLNQGANRDFLGGHPYYKDNNINGINGDPNGDGQGIEIHSLQIPAITRLQEAYVRRILDTLGDLDNVYYEVGNELRCSNDFPNHIVNFVHNYEATKAKKHMVGRSMNFEPLPTSYVLAPTEGLYTSPADWVAPTFANNDSNNPNPPTDSRKVTFYDTDHNGAWAATSGMVFLPWKAFTRGMNMTFADCFENPGIQGRDPKIVDAIKKRQGQTLRYAKKVNLVGMRPNKSLSSTAYCLANPGAEYIAYQPGSGGFSVNLIAGTYAIEWFNPVTNTATSAPSFTAAAGSRGFTPPFAGEAVLYLKASSVTTNAPPSVSITGPANGLSFTAPANVSLAANASDSNGTVSRVEFYNGSTLIGTDTTSPYAFAWNNVAAGSYALSATATDNGGAVGASGTVNVTVTSGGGTGGGTNNAIAGAVSVPTSMTAGQTYSVSVSMTNNGTSTWTAAANYRLGSQNPQDNATWGTHRVLLASGDSIAPSQTKTFTFDVKAPATVGTYNFQWRMVRENVAWFGAFLSNVAVKVSSAPITPAQSPYGGKAWAVPGTIQAEDYDVGGEGVAYHDTTSGNAGAVHRADGVDIAPNMDGGPIVGWTQAGEWLEYTVNVATTGNYTLEARVSAWDSNGTFHVEFNGVNKTGTMTMPVYTGTRQTAAAWITKSKTVALTAGKQVMRIALDANGTTNFEVANLNWIRLVAQVPSSTG